MAEDFTLQLALIRSILGKPEKAHTSGTGRIVTKFHRFSVATPVKEYTKTLEVTYGISLLNWMWYKDRFGLWQHGTFGDCLEAVKLFAKDGLLEETPLPDDAT